MGNERSFAGRGVARLLLHFFSCIELPSVSLFDAALGPVMVIVSMLCGVGLLCLLVHLLCDVLLVGDLLEDLLEDLLLSLDLFNFL